MRRTVATIAVLLVSISALSATAGGTLSVRLVKAANEGADNPSGLQDVIEVLKRSLPYTKYSLVAGTNLSLPADGAERRLGRYSVSCSGGQGALSINVRHGGRELLNTSVSLRDNKPLILGGFPDAGGKLVLVFVAR